MDKLAKLTADIGRLWETYSGAYFTGIRNTLVLAVVATLTQHIRLTEQSQPNS